MNAIATQFDIHKALFEAIAHPKVSKHIPVKGFSSEEPITVQTIEDGIVTHCNHDGAEYDAVSYDVLVSSFDGPDYAEITHAGLVCDKCPAWQSEDGEWHL